MSNNSTSYTLKGPTSDGVLVSPDMSPRFERGYISVLYYTDSTETTLATPTAGALVFQASESDTNFGDIVNGTIDASSTAYERPNFGGPVKKIQVTATGVTGAAFMVVTISRYGGR